MTTMVRVLFLLLLPAALPACHRQTRSADASSNVVVLDISKPVYAPANGAPRSRSEEASCNAWSLDKERAGAFFRLSRPLREGELHDFDWLPCSIAGRLRAQGRTWDFEINAAGTSTWRSGDDTVLLGCAQAACEPLVILMRSGAAD